jgi:hypothetical protein
MNSSCHRLRSLLIAGSVMSATVVLAVAQPAYAAQRQTDFDLRPRIVNDVNGITLNFQTFNRGPDTVGFEVIAWYSWVVEFPTTLVPRLDHCDLVEYEDRGPYTVGVCTKHGPHHSDLPLGALGARSISFDGHPSICDSVTMSLRLDSLLNDPTPERKSLSFGISDDCG